MENIDHLTVRSLSVVDEAGKARIFLDGGTDGGGCSLVMVTKDGKTLQLQEQPNGFVSLGIDGPKFSGEVTLTYKGLCIRDRKGKLGVTIGEFGEEGRCDLTVFRDGQPVEKWPDAGR